MNLFIPCENITKLGITAMLFVVNKADCEIDCSEAGINRHLKFGLIEEEQESKSLFDRVVDWVGRIKQEKMDDHSQPAYQLMIAVYAQSINDYNTLVFICKNIASDFKHSVSTSQEYLDYARKFRNSLESDAMRIERLEGELKEYIYSSIMDNPRVMKREVLNECGREKVYDLYYRTLRNCVIKDESELVFGFGAGIHFISSVRDFNRMYDKYLSV